ncbi:MAG: hypothetical protein ACLUDU_04940 [Butyricimonas faecihominis]
MQWFLPTCYMPVRSDDKKPDTLLIETVPIKQEGDTINFSLALGSSSNTVVIRTEITGDICQAAGMEGCRVI